MTSLHKPVKREVKLRITTRPVRVTLDPSTLSIGFQEKGCRTSYWLPLASVYAMAVRDGRMMKSTTINLIIKKGE